MSGRKTIQVDEAQWRRVQRRARQLQGLQQNVPRLLDDVRAQTRADVDRAFATVAARQRRQDEAVRQLSDRTRHIEADTGRRLREQAGRLHQELHETAGRIEEQTRQRLDGLRREAERALAAERAERRAETARLAQEVDAVKADRARAEETAHTWLADARTMAGLIQRELPHERYAPGRLDRLSQRLATAERNAAEHRFDAALAVGQETFHELSDLRVDIEQRELARCLAQKEAVEALVQVEALAEENRRRPVVHPDGTPLAGYSLDVAHWSGGEYDQVRQDAAAALIRARDPQTGTDDLVALRDEEAPALERSLGETVERAGMRQLTSQLRVDLADVVAQTLAEVAFYDLVEEECHYAGEDERGDFHAVLRHEATGNEIRVRIAQAHPDSDQCVIHVETSDHDVTAEAELRDRADAVYQALRQEGGPMGLETSAPVEETVLPLPGSGRRRPDEEAGTTT
ncbi:hypothetical protein KQH42_28760 [Streptomyces sp. CHA1]|uniref:hypothetical protein n=1 Tax=unclassified Streptomyces TaxID=2593676 RepID=UPI0013981D11|nr:MULTISPECIES: hypothetical protein [unclassified Streptomyces]MBP3081246.1 hypothetical protein [Streptomyces sp. 604F]MBT3158961.1 hypothetical protein [Streptomyces sp. G11C]MCO6704409.1 hypothetical protein [Streptomyces sp. CHB9.2]MCO6710679.1 hypothetical protein [Streptomyces sp. CHA3]MCO6716479.1 hypothetical protein [Streptomyces sp. CHB19.2]